MTPHKKVYFPHQDSLSFRFVSKIGDCCFIKTLSLGMNCYTGVVNSNSEKNQSDLLPLEV
jgi:hypothetical protein